MLLECLATGFFRCGGGGVDVAQAFLAVSQMPLGFESGEHCADGRGAGRINQTRSNLLSRRSISEGKEHMHDFAFASRELFMWWICHLRLPCQAATRVTYCYICSMSRRKMSRENATSVTLWMSALNLSGLQTSAPPKICVPFSNFFCKTVNPVAGRHAGTRAAAHPRTWWP